MRITQNRVLLVCAILLFTTLATTWLWRSSWWSEPNIKYQPAPPLPAYIVRSLSKNTYGICSNITGRGHTVIYVFSHPNNVQRRKVIRSTYGSRILRAAYNYTVIFFLGKKSGDPNGTAELRSEMDTYKDIVQLPTEDLYSNLNSKSRLILFWLNHHCNKSRWFLKVDDDVFINLPPVVSYLRNNIAFDDDSFHCRTLWRSSVIRDQQSKWFTSVEEYPFKYYLPYCDGKFVMYSGKVLGALFKAAITTAPMVWVEDANMYGFMRSLAGVHLRAVDDNILSDGLASDSDLVKNHTWFVHNPFDPEQMWLIVFERWKSVHKSVL